MLEVLALIVGILGIIPLAKGIWFKNYTYREAVRFSYLRSKKNIKFKKSLDKATCYKYKKIKDDFTDWDIIIQHFEKRYRVKAFMFNGKKLPVTTLWENTSSSINPDKILGKIDASAPTYFSNREHHKYIKEIFETSASPIKHESTNYRMVNIEFTQSNFPIVHAALGRYYDNILTQTALEWEVNKIITLNNTKESLGLALDSNTSFPLRSKIESQVENPLLCGKSRCASLTISTLFIFKREQGYYCLLKKRSPKVDVSPDMFHVVPSGMFEAMHKDYEYEWSVKYNVFREFLEEVYNKEEFILTKGNSNPEYLFNIDPIPKLEKLLESKKAELSITGISVNLLDLITEICTVLFIDDIEFIKGTRMELGWEFQNQDSEQFAININKLDSFIKTNITDNNIVYSGAVALELGKKWIDNYLKNNAKL